VGAPATSKGRSNYRRCFNQFRDEIANDLCRDHKFAFPSTTAPHSRQSRSNSNGAPMRRQFRSARSPRLNRTGFIGGCFV